MSARIEPASAADLGDVRRLFREYEAAIGIDLCFQGFEKELANLPGAYAPPAGRLLIARMESEPVGCVALRPFTGRDAYCEMKRLYLRPAARGAGLGAALVERVIAEAKGAGYSTMLLDTLDTMTAAIALYRRVGFRDIPPYYANPLPGVVYLQLDLLDCQ